MLLINRTYEIGTLGALCYEIANSGGIIGINTATYKEAAVSYLQTNPGDLHEGVYVVHHEEWSAKDQAPVVRHWDGARWFWVDHKMQATGPWPHGVDEKKFRILARLK